MSPPVGGAEKFRSNCTAASMAAGSHASLRAASAAALRITPRAQARAWRWACEQAARDCLAALRLALVDIYTHIPLVVLQGRVLLRTARRNRQFGDCARLPNVFQRTFGPWHGVPLTPMQTRQYWPINQTPARGNLPRTLWLHIGGSRVSRYLPVARPGRSPWRSERREGNDPFDPPQLLTPVPVIETFCAVPELSVMVKVAV